MDLDFPVPPVCSVVRSDGREEKCRRSSSSRRSRSVAGRFKYLVAAHLRSRVHTCRIIPRQDGNFTSTPSHVAIAESFVLATSSRRSRPAPSTRSDSQDFVRTLMKARTVAREPV